eukprot:scaffold202644_cov18-Tisochrysis_lutea.AAC.1
MGESHAACPAPHTTISATGDWAGQVIKITLGSSKSHSLREQGWQVMLGWHGGVMHPCIRMPSPLMLYQLFSTRAAIQQ